MLMEYVWDPQDEEYVLGLTCCSESPVHDELPPCHWAKERTRVKIDRKKYWKSRTLKLGEPIEDEVSDNVLGHVSKLPEELKLEILRRISLVQLLDLNPPLDLLCLVLRVPQDENFESWLAKFIIQQNTGYIFIPARNRMFMCNKDYLNRLEFGDLFDPFEVSDIAPGLEAGMYKLRILHGGFDLVKVGYSFISSQCGPQACFHEERQKYWAGSFISRGFAIETTDRSDLYKAGYKTSWEPKAKWVFPSMHLQRRGRTFFFSIKEGFWNEPWKFKVLKPYNLDEVAQAQVEQTGKEPMMLGVLQAMDGEVVGYALFGRCFDAFDPKGLAHYLETERFSVSRYAMQGERSNVGFIITGEHDMHEGTPDCHWKTKYWKDLDQELYGTPHSLWDEDKSFPDEKHYNYGRK